MGWTVPLILESTAGLLSEPLPGSIDTGACSSDMNAGLISIWLFSPFGFFHPCCRFDRFSVLLGVLRRLGRLAAIFSPSPFDRQSFRPFFKIDSLPPFNDAMVVDLKPSHRFANTYVFLSHCLYYQLLKFRRVAPVRYSFWHNKTPHLLSSIPYCLTNGVQFTCGTAAFLLLLHISLHS